MTMRTIIWRKKTLMRIILMVVVPLFLISACVYFSCHVLVSKLSQRTAQNGGGSFLRPDNKMTFQDSQISDPIESVAEDPMPEPRSDRSNSPQKDDTKLFQDSQIANSLASFAGDPTLDVFVVEEHHEVLPYWFQAVRRKVIPKSGNTLIHIDGHSDMAPPYYFSEYPGFRRPRDLKEVLAMMQRNDAFILSASMGDLFKRVIWIWPFWDQPSHDLPYTNEKVDIGIAEVPDRTNKNIKEYVYCMCIKNRTTIGCTYMLKEVTTEGESDDVDLDPNLCKIKKSIVYEEVREDLVLKKLNKKNWLSHDENFLLDIDEDFYGCTHAIQPLLDVNVTMETVKLINLITEQLICPKTLTQEKLADDILVQTLGIFRKPCRCNRFGKFDMNGLFPCKTDTRLKEAEGLLSKTLWSSKYKMACSETKKKSDHNMIKSLVELFKHLKTEQIRVLQQVGFCLTTTLKSFQLIAPSLLHICHGANVPGESVVLIHNPVKDEIQLRTKLLKTMLTSIESYKPKMITLCRSVRDGYTPRNYFNQIENDVVVSLNSSFKHLKFNYDEGLLGGKNGWYNRHQ